MSDPKKALAVVTEILSGLSPTQQATLLGLLLEQRYREVFADLRAEIIATMADAPGATQAKVGQRLGLSPEAVAKAVRRHRASQLDGRLCSGCRLI